MHLCKRLLNFWTWVYYIPWRHPLMQVLIILCDSLSRRDIFGGKWSTFVQYFYTSIVQNYATWYFSFLIFINPTRVLHATILGKTTAAARPVLPIDTSMCSISVCPKNGIAACGLGFVGDMPILIHAIKLLCTISDNPWKQNSSSCRQADIGRGGGGGERFDTWPIDDSDCYLHRPYSDTQPRREVINAAKSIAEVLFWEISPDGRI